MLSAWDHTLQRIVHRKVNACLTPVFFLEGCHVTTVEGLVADKTHGDTHVALDPAKDMHPIQKRIAECHGSQCGFCSPGMVMSLYAHLTNHPASTAAELETAFDGNLCRCTGYRPLLDAAKSFAADKQTLNCAGAEAEEALQGRAGIVTTTASKAVGKHPWSASTIPHVLCMHC